MVYAYCLHNLFCYWIIPALVMVSYNSLLPLQLEQDLSQKLDEYQGQYIPLNLNADTRLPLLTPSG